MDYADKSDSVDSLSGEPISPGPKIREMKNAPVTERQTADKPIGGLGARAPGGFLRERRRVRRERKALPGKAFLTGTAGRTKGAAVPVNLKKVPQALF
jgi:hypothetical protein